MNPVSRDSWLWDCSLFWWWYNSDLHDHLRYYLLKFGMWFIKRVADTKDRQLSQQLFEMAEDYNTRPGSWNYDRIALEYIEQSKTHQKIP